MGTFRQRLTGLEDVASDGKGSSWTESLQLVEENAQPQSLPTPARIEGGLDVGDGGFLFVIFNVLFAGMNPTSDINPVIHAGLYLDDALLTTSADEGSTPFESDVFNFLADDLAELEGDDFVWSTVASDADASSSSYIDGGERGTGLRGASGAIDITAPIVTCVLAPGAHTIEFKASQTGYAAVYAAEARLIAWTAS